MKMIHAGSAAITEYPAYSKNCNLGLCGRAYFAPVPAITDVLLFVNFGLLKPAVVKFTIIDLCGIVEVYEVVTTDCYIIANNGTYWYGVFKKFNSATLYKSYLFALEVTYIDASTATYFSEQYTNINPCEQLKKISVCYPLKYNDEDINGIYIGDPDNTLPIIGKPTMIYQHAFWVRDAAIVEIQNKISFVANKYKNFKSTLNKVHELRTELVPGWYKDYLLSVYFRGQFFIDNIEYKALELNFEHLLEDSTIWKPYVKLDKEQAGTFGCNTIECNTTDCDPVECVAVNIPDFDFPTALVGVTYYFSVALTGTPAFVLSAITKPAWMTIEIVGNNIVFSGTPTEIFDYFISLTITNDCGTDSFTEKKLSVLESLEHLNIANYAGDYGLVTGVCHFDAHFTRTTQAQVDATNSWQRVKATYHIVADNSCVVDVDVIFEVSDTIVNQGVFAECGMGPCSAATIFECTALVVIP